MKIEIILNLQGEEFEDWQGGKVAHYVEQAVFPLSRLRTLVPQMVAIRSEKTGRLIGSVSVTK